MTFWKKLYQGFLTNLTSRKFQAFLVCSFFFYKGIMDVKAYLIIVCAYMGSNILEKISTKMGGIK